MNILKVLSLILMSIFLLGLSPAQVNYCAQKQKIIEHRVLVCHRQPLNDVQISMLKGHLYKTIRLYPDFIKKYKVDWKKPKGVLAIVLFSDKEMNDSVLFTELFPNYTELAMGDVEARYFPQENILCITRAAFAARNPTLPHEGAHWLNKAAGITDKKKDESIAYAFEPYYFSHK